MSRQRGNMLVVVFVYTSKVISLVLSAEVCSTHLTVCGLGLSGLGAARTFNARAKIMMTRCMRAMAEMEEIKMDGMSLVLASLLEGLRMAVIVWNALGLNVFVRRLSPPCPTGFLYNPHSIVWPAVDR